MRKTVLKLDTHDEKMKAASRFPEIVSVGEWPATEEEKKDESTKDDPENADEENKNDQDRPVADVGLAKDEQKKAEPKNDPENDLLEYREANQLYYDYYYNPNFDNYVPAYVKAYHAYNPHMEEPPAIIPFSDENPNACVIC